MSVLGHNDYCLAFFFFFGSKKTTCGDGRIVIFGLLAHSFKFNGAFNPNASVSAHR